MIDKNFAPPGCEAVEADPDNSCLGCEYEYDIDSVCTEMDVTCGTSLRPRPDGVQVIFVRRTSAPATANFPCDDMGAPV